MREVKVYVNDAPSAPAAGLDDHAVKEDVASDHATATYQVPKFTDDEDTELRYEAKLVVVGRKNVESLFGLPQWMNFDGSPGSRTFTFTPDKSWHAGEYRLRVTATDSGGLSDSEDFVVAVAEVNDAPKAPAVGLSEHTVTEDESAVTYQVPKFTDDEDDAARTELRYEAKLVQGGKAGALPKWVAFDAGSRTFTFTPDKSWHAGKYTLRVRGTDSGGLSDSVDFVVTVKDVNDAPIARRLRGCGGCVCDLSVSCVYGRGNVFVGSCIQRPFACFSLVVWRGGFVRGLSCVGAEFFRVGGIGSVESGLFRAHGGFSSGLDIV